MNEIVVSALCNILYAGLLRIREYAAIGNSSACRIEADHLHNIPSIIREGNVDLLYYYYTVERVEYLSNSLQSSEECFANDWNLIALHLEK